LEEDQQGNNESEALNHPFPRGPIVGLHAATYPIA
jgi:hypothetical protein